MNSQRTLIAMIVVTASLASFLGGYLLTQPRQQATEIVGHQTGSILARFDDQPGAPDATPVPGSLFKVSADASLAAVNDPKSDGVLYYHQNNGFVSNVDLATRAATLVSGTSLLHLTGVVWSPDGTNVVASYSSSKGAVYKYFNYRTRAGGVLPGSVTGAVFSPDGSRLALLEDLGDETDIVIAGQDGSFPHTILRTHLSDIALAWPADHLLAFTSRNGTGSDLYTLSDGGALTTVLESQPHLTIRWSPDGTWVLYSTAADYRPSLALRDMATGQDRALPFATSAELCSWSMDGKSFTCLSDENGDSSVRQVSVADLSITTLASDLVFSAQRAFLSHLEDYLVLISRTDQSIWAIKLQ